MCQNNEGRCFRASKPKTVYKVGMIKGYTYIDSTHVVGPHRNVDYIKHDKAQRCLTVPEKYIRTKYPDYDNYQPGWHCFATYEDALIYVTTLYPSFGVVLKCTIPTGAIYRYGMTEIEQKPQKLKTLRSTHLIINEAIDTVIINKIIDTKRRP